MEMRKNIYQAIFGGIVAVIVFLLFSSFGTSDANAKDAAVSGNGNQMKTALLRPGGWIAEWKGHSSGEVDFIFEDRGGKIVVKIYNAAWNQSCERDVTITSDAVMMDGCNETGITLLYDPGDIAYPFKGESKNVNYKLREK